MIIPIPKRTASQGPPQGPTVFGGT